MAGTVCMGMFEHIAEHWASKGSLQKQRANAPLQETRWVNWALRVQVVKPPETNRLFIETLKLV